MNLKILICLSLYTKLLDAANARVNCHPEPGSNQATCVQRGCTWDSNSDNLKTPQCYYPPTTGYVINTTNTNIITLTKSPQSVGNPFGQDFPNLDFVSKNIGNGIYISIAPTGTPRYQPPVPINKNPVIQSNEQLKLEVYNTSSQIFAFSINRVRNNVSIWDTSLGGLLFADQFIQLGTYIPTAKVYGFGESHHPSIQHNFTSYLTWGFLTKDQVYGDANFDFADHVDTHNLYGVHPFYLGLEDDGTAHGVLFFNSNPMEVVTGPGPSLTYRTIGGMLEFFFFPGPTPEDVIRQYQQVIGTPFLPAYWNLGYQLSRAGYSNFTQFTRVVNRTLAAGIPIDTFFVDRVDYMDDGQGFTISPRWLELPNFTNWLHQNNLFLTLNNEPYVEAVSPFFQRGLQQNAAFYEWPNMDMVPQNINSLYPTTNGTKFMLGNVWPQKHVLWPDFTDNVTREWFKSEFVRFHQNISFDAIWLDMNEPSVFGPNVYGTHNESTNLHCPIYGNLTNWVYYLDNPPYWTVNAYGYGNDSYLFSTALCMCGMSSKDQNPLYNTRSLMGWGETVAAKKGIEEATGKRSAIIPRASFVSNGHYGGHWTGDVASRWAYLQSTIIVVQEFNLFGMPYTGSDICGFVGNTTEELCLRWQQAGAFHSFSRNHNGIPNIDQDPAVWPSVAAATIKANLFRYRHLPYLFSLHFYASLYGGTVQRPVFFEFPNDNNTFALSYQFLWGPALMIMPVVFENATTVNGYLPSSEIWYSVYDYFYGTQVKSGSQSFPAPTDYLIPVFVRGGYIVPRQKPGVTTTAGRQNEFQLLVALDSNNNANGELYYDDGVSIIPNDDFSQHNYYHFAFVFNVSQKNALLNITQTRAATNLTLQTLDQLEIFGYPYQPNLNSAQLNGQPIAINTQTSSYSPFTKLLNITTKSFINLNTGSSWLLTWNNQ